MYNQSGEPDERLGGRFALERELGSGGMATVYLGRDEVLDRPVAVKVLKRGFDGDIAERFQREGRTAARLSHPNVVQVYDAGEAEICGRIAPYIVMEHVPGGDLKHLIDAEGHLRAERVARLGAGISAGLAHAHERGVVHRDIKPHNVLLDGASSPKLTDFGIARAPDAASMTVSGVYLGTALYSAPEQLKGEEITPKSDVYALGAALYQAATGEPLFTGTPLEIASQHTSREPGIPGTVRASGIPDPELDGLILDCLAKDPEDRPTAAQARDRLTSISGGPRGLAAAGANDARPPAERGEARLRGRVPAVGGRARRRPVLRTFAGAMILVALLIAGGAFALIGVDVGRPASFQEDAASGVNPGEQASSGQAVSEASGDQSPGGQGNAQSPDNPEPAGAPGGETPPTTTGQSSESGASGEAARTIRDVYSLAATGDYGESYGLLSEDFRQRQATSPEVWAGTFDSLESISFIEGPTAEVSGDTARVTGTTRAVQADGTEINRGTWSLVREDGGWRLDSLGLSRP